MLEKLQKSLDNSDVGEMLLTDLSKTFGCLRNDLLIAKLTPYGFDQLSLCFIFGYLSDREKKTKVNNTHSSYPNIKYFVPQGSILGSLLFNIDIFDLFLWHCKCDIDSYADDNTTYTSEISLNFSYKS